MRLFHKVLFATVAVIASSSATLAADLILDPVPLTEAESAFIWDGFYAGVGLAGTRSISNEDDGVLTGGAVHAYVGVNFVADQFLAGIEGSLYLWSNDIPSNGSGATLAARVGYLVTPQFLVYLSATGEVRSSDHTYGSLGIGTEFAVTENLSLDLEYRQSVVGSSEYTRHNVSASVLWHF